jgi:hypothetical protein
MPVAHACNPSYSGAEIRRISIQSQPGKMRPYLKKPFRKRGLAERLKVEALSSSPRTTKKTKVNAQN